MTPLLLDERVMRFAVSVWERDPFLLIEADPCMFYEGHGVRIRWANGDKQENNWALKPGGGTPRRPLCTRTDCASCVEFREEEAVECQPPECCALCGQELRP